MELRPRGRLDVNVYAVLMKRRWLLYCSFCLISCDTVGMLNIVEGKKKINAATLKPILWCEISITYMLLY